MAAKHLFIKDTTCWCGMVEISGRQRCPYNEECQAKHWALTFDIDGRTCDQFLLWLRKEGTHPE